MCKKQEKHAIRAELLRSIERRHNILWSVKAAVLSPLFMRTKMYMIMCIKTLMIVCAFVDTKNLRNQAEEGLSPGGLYTTADSRKPCYFVCVIMCL